jgi:hypothetical protein
MNRIISAAVVIGVGVQCGAVSARYIEADPVGVMPGVPPSARSPNAPRPLTATDVLRFRQLNHLYLYVDGNPLVETDPSGLIPIGNIPSDPGQAAIFYNFAITRSGPRCTCPASPQPSLPTIPLTPGQAVGGSMALGAGAGAAGGLSAGLAITGAEMGEAAGLIGAAGAAAVAGKTAVTGAAIGGAAGAVAGLAFASVIIASTASSNSCPVQCPPCP